MGRCSQLFITLLFIGGLLLRIFNMFPFIYKPILFVYVTLVPGALLLSSMGVNVKSPVRFVLYAVGVTVFLEYIFMLILNYLLLAIGVARPLSERYILLGFSVTIFIVFIFSWLSSHKIDHGHYVLFNKLNLSLVNGFTFSILLILLSVVGTMILNQYGTAFVLYIFLILVIFAVIVLIFEKIEVSLYPLVVFSVSLSMLYHTSLISNYLWGRDIFNELFILRSVETLGRWAPNYISDPLNSTLSITLFPLFLSDILNVRTIIPFKVIYPIFLSLGMVGFYEWYKDMFNEKVSLFSALLVIFSITFYAEIPQMARVMIGEFFLSILLLSTFNNHSLLSLIFVISLLLTHYSTFYILMFELIAVIIVLKIIDVFDSSIIKRNTKSIYNIIVILFSLSFLWFLSTSKGIVFRISSRYFLLFVKEIVGIVLHHTIYTTSPQHILSMNYPLLVKLTQYLYPLLGMFMIVGLFLMTKDVLVNPNNNSNKGYIKMMFWGFGVVNSVLLGMSVLVPVISRTITVTRVYHIALLFSAPFVFIGFFELIKKLGAMEYLHYLVSMFLIVFLVLNSGVLASITSNVYDDTSIAFQHNSDWPKFTIPEIYGARWIAEHWATSEVKILYGDTYGWVLSGAFNWYTCNEFKSDLVINESTAYIFFRKWNVEHNALLIGGGRLSGGNYYPSWAIYKYLDLRIYNSGMSAIYLYVR